MSGNKSSQPSSASEPESVARSHKDASPVDTTSGRQSSSHWDDSALGSRRPRPGNESSPCGSSRSWQGEAETGKTELASGHVTHHTAPHDPDIQQSVKPIEIYKRRPRKADRSGLPAFSICSNKVFSKPILMQGRREIGQQLLHNVLSPFLNSVVT